jgi:hypothetical protein
MRARVRSRSLRDSVPSFALAVLAAASVFTMGCAAAPPPLVAPVPGGTLQPSAVALEDTTPKEDLRMVPPEVTMRTYLRLFGALAPLDFQKDARGRDGGNLFDTWDDYVAALGFPDYRLDVPRQTQTNALMVATFERIGIALCDRALEHDWKGNPPPPVQERVIFAFDPTKGDVSPADFAPRFDVLHRTFLGYPASLAPAERAPRFYALFETIAKGHATADAKSRFSPDEAGWAAVCYGLVRHPEFHLY